MAKTTEVIVSKESINEYNRLILSIGSSVEALTQEFIGIMKSISGNGIISGQAHEEVTQFTSCINDLQSQFLLIAKKIQATNKQFVTQVDIDDQYLY